MLHKTMIVLATAAALTGGLTADAFALATARSNWDGLGGVGEHGGGFRTQRVCSSAGRIETSHPAQHCRRPIAVPRELR
jgi:hypothetical protein